MKRSKLGAIIGGLLGISLLGILALAMYLPIFKMGSIMDGDASSEQIITTFNRVSDDDNSNTQPNARIKPLPEIQSHPHYEYQNNDKRSPFDIDGVEADVADEISDVDSFEIEKEEEEPLASSIITQQDAPLMTEGRFDDDLAMDKDYEDKGSYDNFAGFSSESRLAYEQDKPQAKPNNILSNISKKAVSTPEPALKENIASPQEYPPRDQYLAKNKIATLQQARQYQFPSRNPAMPKIGKKTNANIQASTQLSIQQLLAKNQNLNIKTQTATGYWANTYIPGDPTIRLLQSQLDQQATDLKSTSQYWQPFDPPKNSALTVYLHSNQMHIQQPTRQLIQVGIAGSERQSGRRPAMNIAVVLDLSNPVTPPQQPLITNLLTDLNQAKQNNDRFSLTLAGQTGATIIPAEQFRYGSLSLAFKHIFKPNKSKHFTRSQAIQQAVSQLMQYNTDTSPLGSSLILFITPNSLDAELKPLESIAHQNAVLGIPLSVIGIGHNIKLKELDKLALAGQGQRRIVTELKQTKTVVEQELHAVSRVVARALRLRIRLMPGVKLVNILGSHPLDKQASNRVRQAEQSIDQRLARNMGIQADRGKDEQGIQMVIPVYYANDQHVILLDVITEKAGLVADVSLRYKDLLYARNGINRASLSLDSTMTDNLTPLELNVLKNLLAFQFSQAIYHSSQQLQQNQTQYAKETLQQFLTQIQSLQQKLPDWHNDNEIKQDIALLQQYIQYIDHGNRYPYFTQLLHYQSFRKVLTHP